MIFKKIYHKILCFFHKHDLELKFLPDKIVHQKCKWCDFEYDFTTIYWTIYDCASVLIDMILPENISKAIGEHTNIHESPNNYLMKE
jgi:hypothetical protein